MTIDLHSLGPTARSIEMTVEANRIDVEGESLTLMAPVEFSGEIFREGEKAIMSGNLKAVASFECTRCLTPFDMDLNISFRAVFVSSDSEPDAPEIELGEDELDESVVEGGQIDLNDVVREQLLLALPEKNFCRDGCQGLCVKCGENLNLIDCKCADEDVDPRWAALKNLR